MCEGRGVEGKGSTVIGVGSRVGEGPLGLTEKAGL